MSSDPQEPPTPVEEPDHLPADTNDSKPATSVAPPVPFTRTAAVWWALIVGSLTLIVLLIFITQNLDETTIHFLGWRWNTPVGVAFLVAAISGSLITVMTGTARMMQLRRAAKKHMRTHHT
jgi:uncharacterized integral membrane protein